MWQAGCLNWGISAVSLTPEHDAAMRYAMRKQDGMYTLSVRKGEVGSTVFEAEKGRGSMAKGSARSVRRTLSPPTANTSSRLMSTA